MRLLSLFVCTLAATAFADVDLPATPPSSASATAPKIWVAPFFNGPAAQVGKTLITYDDIRRELAGISNKLRAAKIPDDRYDTEMANAYNYILNGLVEKDLLIEEFNRRGFQLPAKEVEAEYARILKEQFNGRISELVAQLQAEGLTLTQYKERLGDNIKAQAIQGRFRRSLPAITPEQISAFYNDHPSDFATAPSLKLAVITLQPLADEPAEVVAQNATELRKQILEGADFAEMARTHSTSSEAANGGSWDYISLSDLSAPLQKAVANLKTGEISEPVITDTAAGKVMLIKVLDRKAQSSVSLAEAAPTIEKILKQIQGKAAYEKMIAELKAKTFVKIF